MAGRPRTAIGTYGTLTVRRRDGRAIAETRIRDADGRVRQVRVRARTAEQARAMLKQRLLSRPGFDNGGVLRSEQFLRRTGRAVVGRPRAAGYQRRHQSWLSGLPPPACAAGFRALHPGRDHHRSRGVVPELSVGNVVLARQAIAHPAEPDVRVRATSRRDCPQPGRRHPQLRKPKGTPEALTLEQVAAIRAAAATWRTEPGLPGPKSDGQVRDIIEILLGTAMRPGEVLALRPRDITDGPNGMVAHVNGTVVQRKGAGTLRQEHPKTQASVRDIPVPPLAADVLRRRPPDCPSGRVSGRSSPAAAVARSAPTTCGGRSATSSGRPVWTTVASVSGGTDVLVRR
jgi:integrase